MPYIKKELRTICNIALKPLSDLFAVQNQMEKGVLTYIFYFIALKYILMTGTSYTNISNAISCLDDAAEELRRKVLNPYEDNKEQENGPINP